MEVVFSFKGTLADIVSKDEERCSAFKRRRRQRDGTKVHDTVYTEYRSGVRLCNGDMAETKKIRKSRAGRVTVRGSRWFFTDLRT